MAERCRIPGSRDVRATLDTPGTTADSDTLVVACPPHPQHGGDRQDARLRAVSDALGARGVACLRFDYGPWDEGRGEQTDAERALVWAGERFDTVGLFGYSFGGAVALSAASEVAEADAPNALSLLAPAGTLAGADVAEAVDALACPLQVVAGERDETVDSSAIVERAHQRGNAVELVDADHFFVGQRQRVGTLVADFFGAHL